MDKYSLFLISTLILIVALVSCEKESFNTYQCIHCEAYRFIDSSNYMFIHDDSYCSDDQQLLVNFQAAYVNAFDTLDVNSINYEYCVTCASDGNTINYNDCE